MTTMFDLLEACMNEMENGADLESALLKYPDHAAELRPILESSVKARAMAVPAPSAEIVNRNRAKLLRRAAQMREWEQFSNRRFSSFQGKWAVAFVLLILILFSMANAISASADALPGDGLYPIKRWVENVRLSFALDDTLAGEIAEERLNEVDALFAQGLSERVVFVGFVMNVTGDGESLLVAHIPVVVTSQTQLPDQQISVGMVVRVYGVTRSDGVVIAERIEHPQEEVSVPGTSPYYEPLDTPTAIATESASGGGTEAPTLTVTPTPSPTVTPTSTATSVNPGNVNSNTNSNDNSNSNDNDDNSNSNDDDSNDNDDDNNNNGG